MTRERFWQGVGVLHKHARPLLPALVLLVSLLPMVMDATQRASMTTLGRDQGIFQYVGWALLRGEVDYRDVRDVNGPLTHLVHMFLQLLGGRDEHRFRVLDLLFTGLTFATLGACLPGIGRVTKGRPSALLESSVTAVARIGWAGAAWVVLSAQMLMYLYWDLAQRETFFAWFLLPGIGLQLVAQDRLRAGAARAGKWILGVSGALLVIPCFGKPTYMLFVLAQLLALLIDTELVLNRRARLLPWAAGAAIGALSQIAFLLRFGDIRAFARITFHDIPLAYRFIMTRTPREILSLQWGGTVSMIAVATALVMIALIVDGMMPRRALGIALLPLCAVASVLIQSKGFPYHFHPVSAGLYVQWLALCVWGWERFANAPRGMIHRIAPIAGAAALSWRLAFLLPQSPHILDTWILEKGETAEKRESRDYLVYFRDHDFFPFEIRQAATYLREHTTPTDRVQIYGMDPYVLFLADRLSATPYIYAYDLNADAALQGSWLPEGPHPNEEQAREIKAMRDDHELDLLARVQKVPPAAFVFFDNAPLVTWQDAVFDFHEQCPVVASFVDANYRLGATFKEIRVYLRNDLPDGVASKDAVR
jgi:hypothetical protein